MSSLASAPARASGLELRTLKSPVVAVFLGWTAFALLTLPKALAVWRTGVFLDPDDAMRAVELRDFVAGQDWYDLVPHRLSPDHPFIMHWSRLLDLPLAVMLRVFEFVLPRPADAELAMRLVEPNLLFLLSIATIVGLVRHLIGRAAMLPAALLLGSSIEFVGNFIPGHIHHHAIQATLLLGAAKLLIDALDCGTQEVRPSGLDDRKRRATARALASGACAALSLGIGLQNLPFVIGLAAAVCSAWILEGRRQARALGGFGAGLAVIGVIVFLLDVPPSRYAVAACDAFSQAHLVAACSAGAAFLALALQGSRSRLLRLGLALAAAAASLAAVAITAPACLHDPMSGVDPVLRTRWLSEVGEALPLVGLIARDPLAGLALLATLCCGAAGTAAAAWRGRRAGWLVLALLCAIGFVGTIWQVRVAATTCSLMVPGLAGAVCALFRLLNRTPGKPALLVATLLGMVGNGSVPIAAATAIGRHGATTPGSHPDRIVAPGRCFEPEAFADLKALPQGLVLSSIDPGSAILAFTHHSVLAAPYHRNSYGNRAALLALNETPDAALPLIRESRATYLAICRTSNETIDSAADNPDSLSARLLDGRPVLWLTPLASTGVYRLFRIDAGDPHTP